MNNQQAAFEKLSKLKCGALFMEMGTGKTKVALDLIRSKCHKIDKAVWICPFGVKSEIEAERRKWFPALHLTVVGAESISASGRIYMELYNLLKTNRTFLVVDESLKIKNKDALRTKRILTLGGMASYRLILNGTPLSKNVLDLWTQMQFLSPLILNMSYNQFKNTYSEYYVRGRLKGLVKKQHNIENLVSLISPYIFDSKLEIDSNKHFFDYSYQRTYDIIKECEAIKREMFASVIRDAGSIDFFSLFTRLQNCYTRSIDKQMMVEDIINSTNEQFIVFNRFLHGVPEKHSITGTTKEKDRALILDGFRAGNFKTLYLTYGTGTFGLNLQNCRNVIFSEHTFDYAQKIQAESRVYRVSQTKDVNYYNLWCNCGLEQMIRGSLEKKTNLLKEVKVAIEKEGLEKWLKSI